MSTHRVHRVESAALWRTFHHDGKIFPGWWGGGLHAHPLSLYLPSRSMLHFMPQLRGQIQYPSFMYSVWVPLFLPPPWPANRKVRIYKEYHSVWPLVGIGTLPTPLSPASMPLPQNRGGGAHSPAGEGLGESQFLRLEKKLSTPSKPWSAHHIFLGEVDYGYLTCRQGKSNYLSLVRYTKRYSILYLKLSTR